MNIFVGSLPFKLEEADLKELFEAFGEVTSVKIINDRESGRSKGFGFVEMGSEEEAQAAVKGMDGKDLAGRSIAVSEARPQQKR